MEEKNLTHEESIQIINSMILTARNHYYENGLSAILWGVTNVVCFVLAYLMSAVKGFSFPFNPFFLMGITFVLQLYFDRKERKYRTAKTYAGEMNKYVWLTFGIAVLILTIAGGIADIGYIVLPLLLLLFGMPTFITGCMNKFSPFIIGGIICWLLCIVTLFYKSHETYLLVAAGAVAAWVIPGFILRAPFNKNKLNHGV